MWREVADDRVVRFRDMSKVRALPRPAGRQSRCQTASGVSILFSVRGRDVVLDTGGRNRPLVPAPHFRFSGMHMQCTPPPPRVNMLTSGS